MKIIVYTILKNEIDNIEAWLENTKKAEAVFLLDTGSIDGSWEKLQELQPNYPNLYIAKKTYEHFRFDEARNDNLEMVRMWVDSNKNIEEKDVVCWSIDLDERFTEDWYEKTLATATQYPNFTRLRYQYANRNNNHEIINQRFCVKCHHLSGAYWTLPVHEYQEYAQDSVYTAGEITIHSTEILVSHYQNLKSDRRQYKDLAWERIQADKFDMIGWKHYLDECMKSGADFDTILSIELHIYGKALQCDCDWIDCICGNIATLLSDKSFEDTVMWYQRAIAANKTLRSYYLRLAEYYLYNSFHQPNAAKALEILETMEKEANVIHEQYKEIDGAHSWYADRTFGLALCWAGRYEEAYSKFVKALNILDKLIGTEERYVNRIEAYEQISVYKRFAQGRLEF